MASLWWDLLVLTGVLAAFTALLLLSDLAVSLAHRLGLLDRLLPPSEAGHE